MERDEYNVARLHNVEDSHEGMFGGVFLGGFFLLVGGYGLYNNVKNGETLSILALFFSIMGLLIFIFSLRSLSKSRKKIREISATIPTERLNAKKKIDVYATLVMIFGVIAVICLVLLLIVVGIPQAEGGELSEIISENQTQVIVLSSLFILFVIMTFLTYRKLKRIKKYFGERLNLPSY